MQFFRRSKLLVFLGFLVVGLFVYAPSMNGPFQFDDKRVVLDRVIRERRSVVGFLLSSVQVSNDSLGPLGTRGLVHASILANWLLSADNTFSYHLVNVVVHVVSAWLVFVLVRQILSFAESEKRKAKGEKLLFWLAVFGGAVFLVHPLQSQAVAYITQRFESVMGMFFLASVTLYLAARKLTVDNGQGKIQGRREISTFNFKFLIRRKSLWLYVSAFTAAFLAMSSKEIAITLPVMLVVTELLVVRPYMSRNRETGHGYDWKNLLMLGAFFVLALKIPVQIVMSGNFGGEVPDLSQVVKQVSAVEHQEVEMTRITYLLTEFNVVRTYFRLLFLPYGQSIDHFFPLTTSLFEGLTAISFVFLLAILGVGLWMWKRQERLVTLAVLWFFVPLSVTSTIAPIRDVIYEHRLYLSVVGFVLLLVFLMHKFYDRYSQYIKYGAIGLITVYAGLTFMRSTVWASELKLWEDAWKKGPEKARTNKNYGFVLTEEGKIAEGIERLERAIELKDDDQNYYITLGSAYLRIQAWNKALGAFEKAVEIDPNKPDGWNNLGVAFFQLKQYQESEAAFEEALKIDKDYYMSVLGIGGAKMLLGNVEEGEAAFKRAIELEPTDSRAYSNLISLYIQTKQWKRALEVIKQVEGFDPKAAGLAAKKQVVLKQLR